MWLLFRDPFVVRNISFESYFRPIICVYFILKLHYWEYVGAVLKFCLFFEKIKPYLPHVHLLLTVFQAADSEEEDEEFTQQSAALLIVIRAPADLGFNTDFHDDLNVFRATLNQGA